MGFLELSNTGALEYCNAIFLCVCVSCFYFSCFFAASVTGLFRYSMGYSGIPWDIQVFHGIFRYSMGYSGQFP